MSQFHPGRSDVRIRVDPTTKTISPVDGKLRAVSAFDLAPQVETFWRAHATAIDRLPPGSLIDTLTFAARTYAEFSSRHPGITERAFAIVNLLQLHLTFPYLNFLDHSINNHAPTEVIDALLDPRNIELFSRHLFTKDHKRTNCVSYICGIPFADSGIINRVMVAEPGEGVITNLTHSYIYHDIELALLRGAIDGVVSTLGDKFQMVELGPGQAKLEAILGSMAKAQKLPSNLFLVDCNQTVLEHIHVRIGGLYSGLIRPVSFSFEELAQKSIGLTDEEVFVVNLGTTFCNLPPNNNFNVFKAINARNILLGIYLVPPTRDQLFDMLDQYNGDVMREQAKIGASLHGISPEDIEKCNYRVTLAKVDFSAICGSGFESVHIVLALFDVVSDLHSGLGQTYRSGSTLGGFYSIKYTHEQMMLLGSQHGFDISRLAIDEGSQVALYQLRK